ncbi:MAG: lipoprotein-releasing system permease protein [Thermoanaerobaculia bacterium]|jgi:lipoprotein-releasing system permease protein|nr:lipoprotein-releasing system permease protein [Thermoanaerobaculia bacterium]
MNLPLRIAWRYLRRPTDRLVSAVGFVSVLGLVIGVMALVISMALMTGYRGDLQKKLLGGNAEIFVYSVGGPIADTKQAVAAVRGAPGVSEAAPVLFQRALVTTERNSTGTESMLKGIEPGRGKGSPMIAKIVGPRGTFDTAAGERGVAVGRYLATKLGVTSGQSISITVPTDNGGSFLPRTASFVVTNVFDTGFYEFDARWLFIDLREAESLLNAPGAANLVEVKLLPGADLDQVTRAIDARTQHRYAVSDWRDMNHQLFSMLKIQQLVLFIVIGLIVFVSTFNIVSTLIMTVHEKRKEIGILSSMGAESRMVTRIFVWYGTMVGFFGTASGILIGVAICWIITRFDLVSFPPEIAQVYFVSSIPFITRPVDLTIIAVFSLAVSFLATILPSLRAARLNPVEALRHE